MNERLKEISDLVADGSLEDAINQLRDFISGVSSLRAPGAAKIRTLSNDIIMQAGTAKKLRREYRHGTIDQRDFDRKWTQLGFGVLEIVDDLRDIAERDTVTLPASEGTVEFTPPEESQLEKIWGRNTLQSLSWLHKGIAASRAVCRVVAPNAIGTGFLTESGYIVTNNHVVRDTKAASKTFVEFNFEEDIDGRLKAITTYPISQVPEDFVTNIGLDCSILRIAEQDGQAPVSNWGYLEISFDEGEIEIGQHVAIIQHPSGGQKKISVTANEVVNVFEHRLQYMTDTLPGSSGSPVFNDSWTVIALHHAGGNVVKNMRGERFFANEGILFRDICAVPELRQKLVI
jgi:V8-like Glu-specific endopeptidase